MEMGEGGGGIVRQGVGRFRLGGQERLPGEL
jgi:hypothetical protein